MIGIRDIAEALVNDSTVDVWGETMTYTDTAGNVDEIEAVFDEAYELVAAGNGEIAMTAPVVSARTSDFANATAETDGEIEIGTRHFVVASVEVGNGDDLRLILNERV